MKTKPSTTLIIIFGVISLFAVAIIVSNYSGEKYAIADYQTEIDTEYLTGTEGYGSLRATIIYEKNRGVISDAELIDNEFVDKRYWNSNGPIIDFNDLPHQYTIADLAFPYRLSKKANCDTLIAFKDSITFRFLMRNE